MYYIIALIILYVLYLFTKLFIFRRNETELRTILSNNELDVLVQEYQELRGELKQRIQQRDTLSVQIIVAICGIVSLAVTAKIYWLLMLMPLLSDFYAIQIYESYAVHERLVEFLRENVENRIAHLIKSPVPMWETYCEHDRQLTISTSIGGRKQFMTMVMFSTPILAGILQSVMIGIKPCAIIYYLICLMAAFKIWLKNQRRLVYTGLNKLAYCDYLRKADRTDEPTKAVFLDKDGTLHVDAVMTHKWRDLKILPGVKDFIKRAHDSGYLIIIVTNQSAIGKGIYSVDTMHRFIWLLRRRLKLVDAVYYCPHKFGVECNCRKPKTGMFERAVKELNVDLQKSIMIGDRESDMFAGRNAGIPRNIMVATGLYETTSRDFEVVSRIDEINL